MHFKSGFTIAEVLSTSSGENDLGASVTGGGTGEVSQSQLNTHVAPNAYAVAKGGLSSLGNNGTSQLTFSADYTRVQDLSVIQKAIQTRTSCQPMKPVDHMFNGPMGRDGFSQ